ncbi:hypothetical protein [Paraflavitalea pollutisoli]|uniref:hypothetical protein n=1 Tax=Paraflavitalea pollutisoli TaxID=3034143 RepID=UPI0023EE091A|nr:hypothetical protein [Paraflavitalea sp. H1-2-19X]
MKRLFTLAAILLSGSLQAQKDSANTFSNRAYDLYLKGDYCNAFMWYEKTFEYQKVNYPLYQAAVCACQCGQPAKALKYFNEFVEHGGDFYNYEFFVNDTAANCLKATPDWKAAMASFKIPYDSVQAATQAYYASITDTTNRLNRSELTDTAAWRKRAAGMPFPALYRSIRQFNQYQRPPKTGHWTLYDIRVNDTLMVPFLVYIPATYRPNRPTPLYLFLQGAVSYRSSFAVKGQPAIYEKGVIEKPMEQNAFILYPFARKDINWLYHPAAFKAIEDEIAFLKSLYNIDDNKVYATGHSDGGRGVFWLAINRPAPFAAFLGLNYFPSIILGNTSLGNLRNTQRFYGISGTEDHLFKKEMISSIYNYSREIGANWYNQLVPGSHSLPYNTPSPIRFIYDSLINQRRDPFPRQLQWQTDNTLNGRYYWMQIAQLDTLATPSSWHVNHNPTVPGKNDKRDTLNYNRRRSGAIMANISNNRVYIHTSRVKEIIFYAYPDLVDLSKPVTFYINEKPAYTVTLQSDREVLLQDFLKNKDRRLLPAARINIVL